MFPLLLPLPRRVSLLPIRLFHTLPHSEPSYFSFVPIRHSPVGHAQWTTSCHSLVNLTPSPRCWVNTRNCASLVPHATFLGSLLAPFPAYATGAASTTGSSSGTPRRPVLSPLGVAAAEAGAGAEGPMSHSHPTALVVVYVTVPDKSTGQKLASSIIESKLAACVNRVPGVESTYFWEGKVETSEEQLLIIKTRQSHLEALQAHVKANHPYELPEFIALPITSGSEAYLNWVVDNTKDP